MSQWRFKLATTRSVVRGYHLNYHLSLTFKCICIEGSLMGTYSVLQGTNVFEMGTTQLILHEVKR